MDIHQENGPLAEKGQDSRSNRTWQKNKRVDRKGESNDSPEIPHSGGNIRHPGLPLELEERKQKKHEADYDACFFYLQTNIMIHIN